MKLKISTKIKPLTRLGKLVSLCCFNKEIAIEATFSKFIMFFEIMDEEEIDKKLNAFYEIRIFSPPRISYHGTWIPINLKEKKPYTWSVILPQSGIIDYRIYISGLTESDILLDDFNSEQLYKKSIDEKPIEVPDDTRYYLKTIKIWAMSEILLFFFAGIATLGAIFEILNFFLK